MAVTVLLLCLLTATETYALNYEQFVLDSYRNNCPFSKTCTLPAKQEFTYDRQRYKPCCFQCSCEFDSCVETESCCPDVGNSSILHEKSRYTECLSSIYPVENQHQHKSESMFERYITIRTCPSTYPHKHNVAGCTRLFPKTLDEIIFVSDEFGNIYKNRFCALCNGVGRYKRWNLMITCYGDAEQFYQTISLKFIRRSGCTVWSKVPNIPLLEKRRCYPDGFDTCNITGQWKTYDDDIAKACTSGNFGHFKQAKHLYKNVFCYICNKGFIPDGICSADSIKFDLLPYPFTALIDLRTVRKIKDPTARCGLNKIYDTYADKCRPLTCPVNTIPSYGECLKLFQSTDGFNVNFGLFLTSPTSLLNGSIDIQFVLKSAVFALNNKIETFEGHCRVCLNVLRTEPAMKHLTLSAGVGVATSPTCPESNILALTTFLDNNSILLSITNKQKYNFSITLVAQKNNNFSVAAFGHPHHLYYSQDACVLTDVHITDMQCPRITITGTDYIMALRNNFIKPNDYYNKNLIDKDDKSLSYIRFDVCVDEYFGSSGGSSVQQTTYFISHVGVFRTSWVLSLLMNLVATSIVITLLL